jgi:hypothetical protein
VQRSSSFAAAQDDSDFCGGESVLAQGLYNAPDSSDKWSPPSAVEQFPSARLRTGSSLPLRMTVTFVGGESVLAQ